MTEVTLVTEVADTTWSTAEAHFRSRRVTVGSLCLRKGADKEVGVGSPPGLRSWRIASKKEEGGDRLDACRACAAMRPAWRVWWARVGALGPSATATTATRCTTQGEKAAKGTDASATALVAEDRLRKRAWHGLACQ